MSRTPPSATLRGVSHNCQGSYNGAGDDKRTIQIESLKARSVATDAATIIAVAVGYFFAAKVGFLLSFATRQVTAIWPPAGIALGAIVLRGPRIWPGIFIGAFVSNTTRDESLATAAGIALGNTAGPLLGAYLLRRLGDFDIRLNRLRDIFRLALLGGAVAMMVSATNGVVNLGLGGIIRWTDLGSVWWVWWVGDAMGVLLVAPLFLTLRGASHVRWNGAVWAEFAGMNLALVVITYIVFSTDFPLAYPVFPVIIWIALRFSQREIAIAVFLSSVVAVWQTAQGRGPFVLGSLDMRLAMLVTFMAVLSITAMALGALSAQRRQAEASLKAANDALEERVRLRTAELAQKNEEVEAFVYIVSHDLRAPLVNLQGFSRELDLCCAELGQQISGLGMPDEALAEMRSTLAEGIGGALRYIGSSVSKFERLIDALLALSRTGQQNYVLQRIDMDALARTTIDLFQQSILSAGAVVEAGPLPAVGADLTAIGQVLANLIGNALKYRDPGRKLVIRIEGAAEEGMGHFSVRDTGSGIPEAVQPRLFRIFQRFHPDLAPGDGIGLASTKRIVERHGGRIWVDSTQGQGTVFHFTLPLARDLEE